MQPVEVCAGDTQTGKGGYQFLLNASSHYITYSIWEQKEPDMCIMARNHERLQEIVDLWCKCDSQMI